MALRGGHGWLVALLALAACTSETSMAATTADTALAPSTTSAAVTETTDSAPVDTEPADTEPADTEPADTEPSDTEPSESAEEIDDVEQATREMFAGVAGGDPGCTVAVASGDEVVFADAFGSADVEAATPMTTDTVVDIGSTSKQFTATAIALLVERGTVVLDEPIGFYVPGLPEWSLEVTVDQAVHHTSGIPDYIDLLFDAGFDYSTPATDADTLNVLAEATELDFEPGTSWSYSNSNYFLLGQVVLEVTGDTLGAFLAAEVFEPLELDALMDPVAEIEGKAVSYEQDDDGSWIVADSPWEQTGDGGVQTTPTELVSWASQYWAPTVGGDDINEVRFAAAAPTGDEGQTYGFGIIETSLDGERIVEHSGAWAGFATSFVVAPDAQLAVAVTCTSNETFPESESDAGDIGYDIAALWLP